MTIYDIDPAALRGVALDLHDAARAVDRRTHVPLPPRLPCAGEAGARVGDLVAAATPTAVAAASTADDLEAFLAENRALDTTIAADLLGLGSWSA